jgi:hypothetical protein
MVHFQTKNPDLGKFWNGLAMEGAGKFYSRLVNFTAIWYIVCPFGIFFPVLVYFTPFCMLYQKQSGNPAT